MAQKASFHVEETLAMLTDREWTARENRLLDRLLKDARLPGGACLEELSYEAGRGVDNSLARSLGACPWVRAGAPRVLRRLPDMMASAPRERVGLTQATGRDPRELGLQSAPRGRGPNGRRRLSRPRGLGSALRGPRPGESVRK
ncbi:MAG: ATP-binding protein, partial [Polyangiaceae bacterium]